MMQRVPQILYKILRSKGYEGMRQKVARLVSELKQLVTALADEQAVRALLNEPEWRSLRNEIINFLLSLAATTWPAAKESASETAPWLSPSVQRLQRLQQSPIRRAHVMWVLSLLMSRVSPALLSEEEINQHIAAAGRGVWWGKRCMGCYKAWQRPLTCPDCNRGKALSSRMRCSVKGEASGARCGGRLPEFCHCKSVRGNHLPSSRRPSGENDALSVRLPLRSIAAAPLTDCSSLPTNVLPSTAAGVCAKKLLLRS